MHNIDPVVLLDIEQLGVQLTRNHKQLLKQHQGEKLEAFRARLIEVRPAVDEIWYSYKT